MFRNAKQIAPLFYLRLARKAQIMRGSGPHDPNCAAKNMDKHLIIQAARFGDLVQTKRLAKTLAARGETHICVDGSLAGLAAILFPDIQVHKLDFHGKPDADARKGNEAVFAQLRSLNFDRIYNCNFSPLTYAVCRLFEAERVIGYRPVNHSGGGFDKSPWVRLAFRLSRMRKSNPLNLVDYWAWLAKSPLDPDQVNPPAKGEGGGLGIVLAGRESRRSLPPALAASIASTLARLTRAPGIKLFGTGAEARAAHELKKCLPADIMAKTRDMTGKTGWAQLVEELAGLDLLLTPDTGTMHLAAHLGTPVMAFFLSSALCHETGPYGKGHAVWQAVQPCSPCLESEACKFGVKCLTPFAGKEFLRCLALYMDNAANFRQSLPEGLQCWRGDIDCLGQNLSLVAGQDDNAAYRAAIRDVLKAWLGLENVAAKADNLPSARKLPLFEELFPASEWMLPPWRYC